MRASAVPILQPEILRLFVDVNLAFDHHEIIRAHAQMGARQRLQQTRKVATGIDHPPGPGLLQTTYQALQFLRHGRIFKLREKRPVEIRRDDLDRQTHAVCVVGTGGPFGPGCCLAACNLTLGSARYSWCE